jgi:16S rRNA processing protein RimM
MKKELPLTSTSSTDSNRSLAGRLGRPHGLDGFLGLYADEENLVHFEVGSTVFIEDRPYVVRAIRKGDKGPQISFEDITDRDSAEQIRGLDVFVSGRRQLGESEYWPEDLIGLQVVTLEGTILGHVVDVVLGAAQDRLVVSEDGSEDGIEIPLVHDLVPNIDLEAGRVDVVTLPGLTAPPH